MLSASPGAPWMPGAPRWRWCSGRKPPVRPAHTTGPRPFYRRQTGPPQKRWRRCRRLRPPDGCRIRRPGTSGSARSWAPRTGEIPVFQREYCLFPDGGSKAGTGWIFRSRRFLLSQSVCPFSRSFHEKLRTGHKSTFYNQSRIYHIRALLSTGKPLIFPCEGGRGHESIAKRHFLCIMG